VRVALGALIIQNRKSLSDRELVEEISENPYMQYFLGFSAFSDEPPFAPSLMVYFRKRLGKDIINEINELVAKDAAKSKDDDSNRRGGKKSGTKKDSVTQEDLLENQGTLLLDATCAPADIHYPTDLWLLNETREALEEIIDVLHKPHIGQSSKPRTYRQSARKSYLNVDEKKHKTAKAIRKGIGKQLRYIKRDLKIIKTLSSKSPLSLLSNRQYRNLLVCHEVYRQQLEMYRNRTHKTEDRIVSLHMPFVRPIVRGKASASVEFGAKVAISTVNGFSFLEHLSFDAFNEGNTLITTVSNYHRRFGFYPKAVIADKIYRNRKNISFCKSLGIRLSGPPLGRPAKDPDLLKAQRLAERHDAKVRNRIEAVFGEGKRHYGLGRIMVRLRETSETVIAMQFLVMNLERRLRILFAHFFRAYFSELKLAI
jgi:transposase, IS5 family